MFPVAAALLLHTGARISFTSFTVHPSTVIGIAVLAALYEWRSKVESRTVRVEGRGARGETSPRLSTPDRRPSQRAAFYSALLILFLALNGWIHDLSDSFLFSAHMVQHLLLALAVAPLMIMGTPGWMLRPLLDVPRLRSTARWLTGPRQAFAIFNIVVAGWHLPPLYNTAMAHHGVHIVQHLMFLAASVIMWWPVLSPLPELPRLSYPAQMLYLFLMTIPMSIVSVAIAYADQLLYPAYSTAPRIWGLTPMADQMLGGLIMWIPGGLYFFVIISVIFFRWQQKDGAETTEAAQVA
jgi:putative membrane protein